MQNFDEEIMASNHLWKGLQIYKKFRNAQLAQLPWFTDGKKLKHSICLNSYIQGLGENDSVRQEPGSLSSLQSSHITSPIK